MNSSVRFARLFRLIPLAAGILLAVFLLGMRWDYIGRFASDLPVWDQWDAEGLHLLAPWKEHRPLWPEIFQAHNEHRVVLTKLVNLALTAANGCWDQRVESVFNSLLPAVIAAGLFLHSRRFCPPFLLPLLWLLLAVGWGSPLAWENMVSGFHSQQLFLIGLSYGAIACLATARPWTTPWWLGAACAVLALGSMASGFLAAFVVLGLLGWQLWRRDISWRDALPALAVALVVFLVGAATRVTVDYHEGFKAHTVSDFLLTLFHSLQWPAPRIMGLAALVWAPWVWLVVAVLRRPRGTPDTNGLVLLGMGGWVLLQLLATAYVRGNGGLPPPARYLDTLVFGMMSNALALGWLFSRRPALTRRQMLPLASLAALWLGVIAWGLGHHIHQGWLEMNHAATDDAAARANTRAYLLTNDTHHLETSAIPYPDFASFLPRINQPSLRALMPASVRPPLEMTTASGLGFIREKIMRPPAAPTAALPAGTAPLMFEPFWSSWNENGPRNTGEWNSRPLWTSAGWIELRITGAGGPSGVALEIRDSRMGYVLAVIPAPAQPGAWEKVHVRVPNHGFVLAAVDQSATGWLAFSAPVEVPALSYLALCATWAGSSLARLAAGGALLLAGLALLPRILPSAPAFRKLQP